MVTAQSFSRCFINALNTLHCNIFTLDVEMEHLLDTSPAHTELTGTLIDRSGAGVVDCRTITWSQFTLYCEKKTANIEKITAPTPPLFIPALKWEMWHPEPRITYDSQNFGLVGHHQNAGIARKLVANWAWLWSVEAQLLKSKVALLKVKSSVEDWYFACVDWLAQKRSVDGRLIWFLAGLWSSDARFSEGCKGPYGARLALKQTLGARLYSPYLPTRHGIDSRLELSPSQIRCNVIALAGK